MMVCAGFSCIRPAPVRSNPRLTGSENRLHHESKSRSTPTGSFLPSGCKGDLFRTPGSSAKIDNYTAHRTDLTPKKYLLLAFGYRLFTTPVVLAMRREGYLRPNPRGASDEPQPRIRSLLRVGYFF